MLNVAIQFGNYTKAPYCEQRGPHENYGGHFQPETLALPVLLPFPVAPRGFMPDLKYRYLAEDVPTGLCFTKGLAELLEVPTPTIDKARGAEGDPSDRPLKMCMICVICV